MIADAPDRTVLYGAPATPAPHGRRAVTIAAQLPELVDRIRELEKQVADLLAKQGKS